MNNKYKKLYFFFNHLSDWSPWYIPKLLILIMAETGLATLLPWLYGKMIDLIGLGHTEGLVSLMTLYFFSSLLSALLRFGENLTKSYLSFKMTYSLKTRLAEKILYLKCEELDTFSEGELMSRLNGDVSTVVTYSLDVLTSILNIVFNLIISVLFIIRMSLSMSFVVFCFTSTSIFFSFLFRKMYKKLQKKKKAYWDKVTSFQIEFLHNLPALKSFCQECTTKKAYETLLDEDWNYSKTGCSLNGISSLLNTIFSIGGTLTLIYMAALLINAKTFTLGMMVSFLSYVSRLGQTVSKYLSLKFNEQGVLVCLDRIGSLESRQDEKELLLGKNEANHLWNQVTLENVSFSYRQRPENVLHMLNLVLPQKGLYAIVGENGCGKSSLLKLLVRLYDYTEGSIKIGNRELSDIGIADLREHISYIPQKGYLSNKTILENINMMRPDASDLEVRNVVQKVGLQKFIQSLPDGLSTPIGEDGKFLSSGQRQKICIARAILKNPDIYLFDEITSNMDGRAEREILEILEELASEKIVIHVAHRICAVVYSSQIFVMSQGRITDSGTHSQLLSHSAIYRNMFLHQQQNIKLSDLSE